VVCVVRVPDKDEQKLSTWFLSVFLSASGPEAQVRSLCFHSQGTLEYKESSPYTKLKFACFGGVQYGKDYDYDSPVKLLDKLLHSMAQTEEEQLVVVSQV
jgi:hypothetical protein